MKLPNIRYICEFLDSWTNSSAQTQIHEIIKRFKLNEEILSRALPILCKNYDGSADREELENLLDYYASAGMNENLRLIALNSLKHMNFDLLKDFPHSVFSLLLDDEEEVRNETCKLLNTESHFNLAETLNKFVEIVGKQELTTFLSKYELTHRPSKSDNSHSVLFDREQLNLFIDVQFLRKKFL